MCSSTPPHTAHSRRRQCLYAMAAGLLAASPALAQPAAGDFSHAPSIYLQVDRAEHGTDALTAGTTLPWRQWRAQLWGGELRGHWDIYLSRWSFDGMGGHNHSLLLGVTPTLRLRPDGGRSAWFWEAGIGATLANRRYRPVGQEAFGTRFNFASHLGLGVSLGAQRRHELLLRLQHVSNAGIKEPNPGLNLVQLRYALHF